MANTIGNKVWSLDTSGVIVTGPVIIKDITWQPAATSNDLIINDALGGTIIDWDAPDPTVTPQLAKSFGTNGEIFRGLTVDTIDGGTVKVTIK